MVKLKHIALIELVIILLLLGVLIKISLEKPKEDSLDNGLLSPRVYTGILKPKSFLIANYAPLKNKIQSFIDKNNLTVSVYVENLRNGASFGVNGIQGYYPASMNKVPVAMLIMKQVEDGKLSMDMMIPINDSYRSNEFGTLYKTKEKELPLRVLIEAMLKESDDTAFKTLAHYIDDDEAKVLLKYLDYYSEDNSNVLGKDKYAEYGLVTPKSMYNLFSTLYLSTVLGPKDSDYILSLMTNTTFDIKEIAKLPENVTVSQKFGLKYSEGDKYLHSCGIMYFDDSKTFYCVMTKDLEGEAATKIIGVIVNNIYYYSIYTSDELENYKELYDFD